MKAIENRNFAAARQCAHYNCLLKAAADTIYSNFAKILNLQNVYDFVRCFTAARVDIIRLVCYNLITL